MAEERSLEPGRWRRGVLLAALCALVYYIGYDHGRESLRPRLEEREARAREERDRLLGEIVRLQARAVGSRPEEEPAQAPRIALKVNQSRTLLSGRLMVSLLAIDDGAEAVRARVKVDAADEGLRLAEDMAVGDSLRFKLGGRDWSLALSGLTRSTVNLSLTEIKNQ